MNDMTQLGAFARRQLRSMHDTALAGAKNEALKLRVRLLRAEEELARGIVPSGELSTARLDSWLSQLHALQEMKAVLDADAVQAGRPLRAHLYERFRDYSRDTVPNPAQMQEVRAIIHREHVLAGGDDFDPECPNCIDHVLPSQE